MKIYNQALVRFRRLFFFSLIASIFAFSPAFSQSNKYTLLVQQTPSDGGQVTPLAGSYKYDPGTEITLTAKPNNGYEFAYWLGDVSNQQASSTIVLLNKPKIIIAVFQPIQNNLNVSGDIGGGGAISGLVSNPVTIGQPASLSSGGAGKPQQQKVYAPAGENPPVVPEPATGVLLTLGSILTFTKKRKRKVNLSQNESRIPLS